MRSSTEVEAGRGARGGQGQAISSSAAAAASTNLSRSRSAQSLRAVGAGFDPGSTQEDKQTIMAQLFCIAVSLMESDYDHEFLLALKLLEKASFLFFSPIHTTTSSTLHLPLTKLPLQELFISSDIHSTSNIFYIFGRVEGQKRDVTSRPFVKWSPS